jgi:hypothetical protein
MAGGNLTFFFRYSVHDLEVFFLPTTLVLAVLAGSGAQLAIDGLERFIRTDRVGTMKKLLQACLLLYSLSLVLGNYHDVDMSEFDDTEEYIAEVVDGLPRGATILNFTTPNEWKLDAVFGMYVQKVLGKRGDVDIMFGATPDKVNRLLDADKPVYAYAPMPFLLQFYALEREGRMYRLLKPDRVPPSPPAP